ncbi:MAG: lipocalin-like domain-containing protein [Vicinamibacterales bacterium]
MRIIVGVLLAATGMSFSHDALAGPPPSSPPSNQGPASAVMPQPASTMSDLMVKIIYPASDAIFYITTRQPKSEAEWVELEGKALAVAESGNLLMMPGRARDQDRWMQDAKLMLDAGRAAFRAAKAKDVAALDALNDQLYTSCTSCHQHYRPNYGRRPSPSSQSATSALIVPALPAPPAPPAPPASRALTLEGRWKLRAAEDIRADGTVARLPWGEHPVGSIVVEHGSCYLQIMSSDTPSFAAGATSVAEQMKTKLLSSYIAYSGPCTIDEAEGSVTLKVVAAWRPDYVGTEQKRFFRFANGVLLFGPAQGSIRAGSESLTRRLTLDRVQ